MSTLFLQVSWTASAPEKLFADFTAGSGHIYTKMTAALLDVKPEQGKKWAAANPLGRLGHVHELRGGIAWLASDASTFCTGSDILINGGHCAW